MRRGHFALLLPAAQKKTPLHLAARSGHIRPRRREQAASCAHRHPRMSQFLKGHGANLKAVKPAATPTQ